MTGQTTSKRKFRMRGATVAILMVLSIATTACTQGQIEGAFNQFATPFEAGYLIESATGLLFTAGLVLSYLIAGLGLGPGFF